jgi:hypothetical protein
MSRPSLASLFVLGACVAMSDGVSAQSTNSNELAPATTPPGGQGAPPQDTDLDRIPLAPITPSPTPSSSPGGNASQTIYVENTFDFNTTRGGLSVPPPVTVNNPWQEHLFLDVRKTWRLAPDLTFSLSSRTNFETQSDIAFPDSHDVRLDVREGYFSWMPDAGTYVDVGRINLKSGVAIGSNPTDFFKARAVVDPTSQDPEVLRNDRLGTLMARIQQIWSAGAVTFAYAPKVASLSRIYTDETLPSLNPMLDRTNASNRFLIKANVNVSDNFSPEALVYHADGRTKFGLNITDNFGKSVVGYVEWSGGVQPDLASQAVRFGRDSGDLPPNAPLPFAEKSNNTFRNDAVLGASYTTSSQIVFNLEYHYFGAGFSPTTWRSWFLRGEAGGAPIRAELWYIRDYAQDQQLSITKQSVFVRFDRTDAFIRNFELQGFISDDLYDGSASVQVEGDYYLSNHWTISGLLNNTLGSRHSDFGSLPAERLIQLKVARYF